MGINIIKEEIRIIIETLAEQYSIINQSKGKIPQIEIDIVMSNVRRLYERLYDLNKLNSNENKTVLDETAEIKPEIIKEIAEKEDEFPSEEADNFSTTFENEEVKIEETEEEIVETNEPEILAEEKLLIEEKQIVEEKPEIEEKPLPEEKLKVEQIIIVEETPEIVISAPIERPDIEKTEIIAEEKPVVEEKIIVEEKPETVISSPSEKPDLEKTVRIEPPVVEEIITPPLPPKAVKPGKTEEIDLFSMTEKEIVADKFKETQKSMHDKLSHEKTDKTLADKIGKASISNLKSAIGINDKFLFINELFKGDINEYNQNIEKLNSFTKLEDITALLEELSEKFHWSEKPEAYQKLEDLIIRKFL